MKKFPKFSHSFKYLALTLSLALLSQNVRASDDVKDLNTKPPSTLVSQSIQWLKENPVLLSTATAAAGVAAYYYAAPSPTLTIEDPRTAVYIPQSALHTIADNITSTAPGFVHQISGWVSSCYNPNLYTQYNPGSLLRTFANFSECMTWCMGNFNMSGASAECYDFVMCWSKAATTLLACDLPSTGWWLSNATLYETFFQGHVSSSYNTTTHYHDQRGIDTAALGFHFDVHAITYWRMWDPGTVAINP